MAVTRGRKPATRTTAKRTNTRPAKAEPVKTDPDVTAYAVKAPTDVHRAFARWCVEEIGYEPNDASSARAAFLKGVSLAFAARPQLQSSEWLENWRNENGVAKVGRKRKDEEEVIIVDEDDDVEEVDDEDPDE